MFTSCTPHSCRLAGQCVDVLSDGRVHCVCEWHCPTIDEEEVCASDGRLYAGRCAADLASCQRQTPIYVLPDHGACREGSLPPTRHRARGGRQAAPDGKRAASRRRVGTRSTAAASTA